LNIRGFNDVRHIDIHIAEPIVPEPTAFDIAMGTEMLIKI